MTVRRKTVEEEKSGWIFWEDFEPYVGLWVTSIYLFLKSSKALQLCTAHISSRNFPCFWKAYIIAYVAIAKSSPDMNINQRSVLLTISGSPSCREGRGGEREIGRKIGRGRSLCNEWENHWRVCKQLQCMEATASETVEKKITIRPIICPHFSRDGDCPFCVLSYVLEIDVKVKTMRCSQYLLS